MNGLDLFSGIGGISLGLRDYVKPIAYCEIDSYCQGVLLSRISEGLLTNAPIWNDIKTLSYDGKTWPRCDIVYGGFPCQDISVAGLGKGLAGERSGLFFEIVRLCREIKPRFIFLENVPAITIRGGVEVVRQIASLGYDCRWCVISAASVGALHKRERWFLLAHATSESANRYTSGEKKEYTMLENTSEIICNTNGARLEEKRPEQQAARLVGEDKVCHPESEPLRKEYCCSLQKCKGEKTWRRNSRECWPFESREHWQETVSTMGKLTDGLPNQVDRLRALGNAVVPQQVKKAFEILMFGETK